MFDPIEALKEYVSHSSVSTDSNHKKGMQGARAFVTKHLQHLNFEVEIIETPLHPIILATHKTTKEKAPHVLIYDHYDVQPADPLDLWASEPFKPEVRGDRLFGRGAADNKGPFVAQLAALTELLEKDKDFPLNITFLVEGEEEIGSPSFGDFLEKYKDRLSDADFIILSDTASPDTEQVAITTALRGIVAFEIEVTGPNMDLHSGAYGGAVYNPIQALTEICASLHDKDGRVNVPDFYDDVLEVFPWEKEELDKLPTTNDDLKDFLGVPALYKQKGFTPLQAIRFLPTLELNGIGGGYQGEGTKTVIPSKAFAKITCRLVPNQEPDKIKKLVMDAIKERCPKGVTVRESHKEHSGTPYLVVPPHRPNTPKDQPKILEKAFDAIDESVKAVFGKKPLYIREGGSVPIIHKLKWATGLDSIMLGLYTPSDNLHAPNESFHLDMMKKGIEVYKKFLCSLAGV